ncbi:FxsA family membrane protein [Streptomyces sp. NPDC059851]|uniref:FxsA family membrane protein n=1 Tax=Streptomyces sp. NPDC059851 TaxID=3346971 RepID=UPI00366A0AB6
MTTGAPTSTAHRRRRSPARTFLPLAIAVWLILEIWLLGLVADAAGGLTVAALIVGGIVLGAVVIKRAGRRAFKNLSDAFQQAQQAQQAQQGQPPAAPRSGTGNALTMLAGLLLILPGLLSDVAGLLCLIPPVRAWIGRRSGRLLERRMATARSGSLADAFQQARIHQPDGKVVQGQVIREDRPDAQGQDRPGSDTGFRPPLAP